MQINAHVNNPTSFPKCDNLKWVRQWDTRATKGGVKRCELSPTKGGVRRCELLLPTPHQGYALVLTSSYMIRKMSTYPSRGTIGIIITVNYLRPLQKEVSSDLWESTLAGEWQNDEV